MSRKSGKINGKIKFTTVPTNRKIDINEVLQVKPRKETIVFDEFYTTRRRSIGPRVYVNRRKNPDSQDIDDDYKTNEFNDHDYITNTDDNHKKSRDNFISNNKSSGGKLLRTKLRQPIIIKRNTSKMEKLKEFRRKLMELSVVVDLEIHKTDVEWLGLTYHAEKLRQQTTKTTTTTHQDQVGDVKITIDEIDEQLRTCAELPALDLRSTIPRFDRDEEEFDTDSD